MFIMCNEVIGYLWPCMIIFRVVFLYFVTLSASNTTMSLLSHRLPIDMSDFCRPGKMCALCELSGRLCCGSNAMWVDLMISPFGILIGIGFFAIHLSMHGVFVVM